MDTLLKIQSLGQAGFRLEFAGTVVFIDPYLSHSVQEKESADLVRMRQIPIEPSAVIDADWIIITHEHRDHCDLDSLLPISQASENCCFLAPPNAVTILKKAGISTRRIWTAVCGDPIQLNTNWKVYPVPAAHPTVERDSSGKLRWLGYVIQVGAQNIYHAGDTSAAQEIIDTVKNFGKIDLAFLPINERNYFLDRREIIGNMSIREAFKFAEEIGINKVIPIHWDMFEINSVFKEEIELLYDKISPGFSLSFEPYL